MSGERPQVTVVGLGPAGVELVPRAASSLLLGAPDRAFLRTDRHPAAAAFGTARSFDDLYGSARGFDEVYDRIVDALVAAAIDAMPEPVIYAVPGSPTVAERSVVLLLSDPRVEVTVLPAPSFLDLAWLALDVDPVARGVRLVDADAIDDLAVTGGPLLVAQCWSRHLLSEIKLARPDDAELVAPPRPVILHHLGLDDELVREVDWWDLDRNIEPDHLTSLYVPSSARRSSAGVEVERLVRLTDTLRERCPWDRAQTHASLQPHLVEECYEVLDALSAVARSAAFPDRGPSAYAHLEEELGDLLFQILFHARLADEAGQFDLAGVARGVREKLVRRHPHVFGDVAVSDAADVAANWEAIKKDEKGRSSVTEGIPESLPALMLAAKLSRKARSVGLTVADGDDRRAVELTAWLGRRAAGAEADADDPLRAAGEDELVRTLGDLLLAVVTMAQRLGVDAEQALRERIHVLRAEILRAEGVPDHQMGNR
jgi:tetrapyrrole methylase family protein/MazG family protein